ncbi:hypothetical protein Q3W71_18060 [Micromonospora sp. C28SCA-DRY-2]|uniref:hypothetical protein n=1 Tax=Micromonospora sp. C28SCA-DRY-2 TaxID=3059522 RepID=UPI0026773530|nr:hypothetical protein [Micromonospora sp. C28SCA-DRY-2]MDO3703574.1 hypothetical protein [Micromonospora sp. C28SCA-DRY-2]
MRSALSLVLAGVIAVALGVFGSVALATTLTGTSSSEAAKAEQAARSGSGGGNGGANQPLVYGTR